MQELITFITNGEIEFSMTNIIAYFVFLLVLTMIKSFNLPLFLNEVICLVLP